MEAIEHVQLFDVARTAHFERVIASGSRTRLLYARRRYDFDERLAREAGARRAGLIRSVLFLLRTDVGVLEVTEPLALDSAPRAYAAMIAVRFRALLRRQQPTIVASYAIENKDPATIPAPTALRSRAKRRVQWACAHGLWRALDRVAFGTPGAHDLYSRTFRTAPQLTRLIPAIPAPGPSRSETEPRAAVVAFLGEFSERKGFFHVLEAWPRIARCVPGARLLLIGTGPGIDAARALSASDGSVDTIESPARQHIFALLDRAKVLVLPSQPRPRWREQVGLPIVEALSRGCEIVTTRETGISSWLAERGHRVVDDPSDLTGLADAVCDALADRRSPAQIQRDLPPVDGRHAAEMWLIGHER